MKERVRLLLRADDAGLFHAKNEAIAELLERGLVKNVSVMSPVPYVEEAYDLFKGFSGVCFGLHGTILSEWDGWKFGPLSATAKDGGLTDGNGNFFGDQITLAQNKPTMEAIVAELDAQLQKLRKIGFTVSYVDSHMLPEFQIPGMFAAVGAWAKANGLIDHQYYYTPFLQPLFAPSTRAEWNAAYAALPDGELFHVLHPSKRSPESALMYNAKYPKREAKPAAAEEKRGLVSEYEYFADPDTARVFSEAGIRTITYAEAVPCPINSFLKIKREQDAKKDGNP